MLTRCRHGQGWLIVLSVLSFMLGGCATSGDTEDSNPFGVFAAKDDRELTPEERQMREDASLFRNTVVGGAVALGAIAGLLCLLDTDAKSLGKCAAHAMIGGALGAVDGYLIAKQQESARKQVRGIDLIVQEIKGKNRKLQRLVDSSRKVVEQNRESIDAVKLGVAENRVREGQLEEERERLQSNIDVMDRTIASLTKDKETYQMVADKLARDGENVTRLRTEVADMNVRIAMLKKERDGLEQLIRTSRIG